MTRPERAVTRLCSVPGCGRKHEARDLCAMHRARVAKHGSVELPARPDVFSRAVARVASSGDPLDCWLWTGGRKGGGLAYGAMLVNRESVYAHRWFYEYFIGPIPAGLVLDHLCRIPICVNPWHLEPVTNTVNILRGESEAVRTHREGVCRRGHSMADAIIIKSGPQTGRQNCRTCDRARRLTPERRAKRRAYKRRRRAMGLVA